MTRTARRSNSDGTRSPPIPRKPSLTSLPAGREFAQLLRVIQTRGDYAKEVLEAENAEAMVKVIQNLANDIRNGSEVLKAFIRTLTPPDA